MTATKLAAAAATIRATATTEVTKRYKGFQMLPSAHLHMCVKWSSKLFCDFTFFSCPMIPLLSPLSHFSIWLLTSGYHSLRGVVLGSKK